MSIKLLGRPDAAILCTFIAVPQCSASGSVPGFGILGSGR
jgi:hypothetical protein